MKTEEIIDRLRNPQKYQKITAAPKPEEKSQRPVVASQSSSINLFAGALVLCILAIAAIVLLFALNAQKRADNISETLDPNQIKGLTYETDFNPYKDAAYVQVYEGQDRNASVSTLGITLPIISRFNYQAITPKNYGVIGMAPWGLTENFSANLNDVDLIRYLLNRQEVATAFVQRPDVAPLLEDTQLLAAFSQDHEKLKEFFEQEPVSSILANPDMIQAISTSRFMSHLLTSKSVKYYRDHPKEAAKLIQSSPVLKGLTQNPGIRKAAQENYYLKPIANQLLGVAQKSYAPAKASSTKK